MPLGVAMRGMVASFLLITPQGVVPAPPFAAPTDFRVIPGPFVHPGPLGPGVTVMVLKSDEGTVYYADLRAVSRIPALQQGAMVTLVGFEGARPDQLVIQVMYPADAAPADTPSRRSQR